MNTKTSSSAAGRFQDQVVVVTGAARGIGMAIAEAFAREGAALALADVTNDELQAVCEQLRQAHGARVIGVAGDLSTEAGAQALLEQTRSALGEATILVNNAGGGVILPFLSHTPETLKTTVDRNLWTVLWCTRAFLPAMVERRYGRIVNLGADSVRNGLADHAAYNAAKGGVHGLTTGLGREFATHGVTVNTVAPCAVNGEPLQRFIRDNPEVAKKFLSVIPMERAAELEEVASMVTYLASREAAFVTGQVISVNGGSTML
ncbi:SDR family oxidoreductase [Hydrogenophaga sp.]|uniref:SDR family oxidoreductase n=1 Tax=Hydrogenophaga sp. TaxID=1904254 RepID=UPI003565D526